MHPYSEQLLQLFSLEYKEEVSLVKLLKVTFRRKIYLFMSVCVVLFPACRELISQYADQINYLQIYAYCC